MLFFKLFNGSGYYLVAFFGGFEYQYKKLKNKLQYSVKKVSYAYGEIGEELRKIIVVRLPEKALK